MSVGNYIETLVLIVIRCSFTGCPTEFRVPATNHNNAIREARKNGWSCAYGLFPRCPKHRRIVDLESLRKQYQGSTDTP